MVMFWWVIRCVDEKLLVGVGYCASYPERF